MKQGKKIKESSAYQIVSIVKFASLFFSLIIVYTQFVLKDKIGTNIKPSPFNLVSMGLFTCVIILSFLFWVCVNVRKISFKYIKIFEVTESFIIFTIFSKLIIVSNIYKSNYKFLFLFIILISTIQLYMNYGMVIAFVFPTMILATDLIYAFNIGINTYSRHNLIFSGVFILILCSLVYHVKITKNIRKKEKLQLEILSNELSKQDKQRVYMEETLLKNEGCYNLLIENSHDAIFVHRQEKIIFANESAVSLVGFKDVGELKGKSVLDFIPDGEKGDVREKFVQVYNEKITRLVFEEKLIKSDGHTLVIESTSTYFIYKGNPAILSILRDISSERQVEQLEKYVEDNIKLLNETREFNKLITEFFTNISHELKTPLNVIYSAVQVLSIYDKSIEDQFTHKREQYMQVMKQNCYRLMRLINNLLDMTKLDSGFLMLNLKNYNIVSIVENITLSVTSYAESKGVSLIFDTDVEEKVMAVDPDKIERIILNLLSNAIKFVNSGGDIFVNIMDMGDSVVISVKDTGIGIAEDKLDMIFERFRQVDKTLRRNHEGSGIGLSLVKSFVEMHGGSIEIKSKLQEGSEFIIKLPVTLLEEEVVEEHCKYDPNIQRIHIEFSDIYSDNLR